MSEWETVYELIQDSKAGPYLRSSTMGLRLGESAELRQIFLFSFFWKGK